MIVPPELPDKASTSITNLAEQPWPEVIAVYLPSWLERSQYCHLIEHHPAVVGRMGHREKSAFDRVSRVSFGPRTLRIGRDHLGQL